MRQATSISGDPISSSIKQGSVTIQTADSLNSCMCWSVVYECQWLVHIGSMECVDSLQTFLRLTNSLRTLRFFNSPSQASLLIILPLFLFQPFPLLIISRYLVGFGTGKGGLKSRLTVSNPMSITSIYYRVVSNAPLHYFSLIYCLSLIPDAVPMAQPLIYHLLSKYGMTGY